MGELGVAGGVSIIEDYRPTTLPAQIEPYLTEIVLIFSLQVLVGIEVLVIAVVETL